MGLFTKIFGTYSEREVKRVKPIVDKIEALADTYRAYSDDELRSMTPRLKERLVSRSAFRMGRPLTIFCPTRLLLSERRQTAFWASAPSAYSLSAVSFCIRDVLPK